MSHLLNNVTEPPSFGHNPQAEYRVKVFIWAVGSAVVLHVLILWGLDRVIETSIPIDSQIGERIYVSVKIQNNKEKNEKDEASHAQEVADALTDSSGSFESETSALVSENKRVETNEVETLIKETSKKENSKMETPLADLVSKQMESVSNLKQTFSHSNASRKTQYNLNLPALSPSQMVSPSGIQIDIPQNTKEERRSASVTEVDVIEQLDGGQSVKVGNHCYQKTYTDENTSWWSLPKKCGGAETGADKMLKAVAADAKTLHYFSN